MKRLKISSGGQMSVPAAVRHRWGTRVVSFDDQGDHAVIRPAPENVIEATAGIFADEFAEAGITSDVARRQFREEERRAEERKFGPLR